MLCGCSMNETLKNLNDKNLTLYTFDRVTVREDPSFIRLEGPEVSVTTIDNAMVEAEMKKAGFRRDSKSDGMLYWSARAEKFSIFKSQVWGVCAKPFGFVGLSLAATHSKSLAACWPCICQMSGHSILHPVMRGSTAAIIEGRFPHSPAFVECRMHDNYMAYVPVHWHVPSAV